MTHVLDCSQGLARTTKHRTASFAGRVVAGLLFALPLPLNGQTDYYNTDAGRPFRTEDAYATERYAFELQLAPLRLERARGGIYSWGIEPEIAYGILPRTHLEIGLPFAFVDAGPLGRHSGLAGIDISLLHNLNVETRTLPAFGLVAEVLAPVGGLAPEETYASIKGIATRTLRWARFHLNGQYTFGDEPSTATGTGGETSGPGAADISRWVAGVAVDRTFPLRSTLVGGEVYARRPINEDDDVEWNAAIGIRYQLDPYFAIDAGVGKRLTGDDQSWFVTFGLARQFAIRALMPGR